MRNYNKISPRIWTGSLGLKMRGDAVMQSLAVYLATNQHVNMVGLYYLPIDYMVTDLGHKRSPIEGALKGLIAANYCRYDWQNQRVWVVEFMRHEFGDEFKATDKRVLGIPQTLKDHSCSTLTQDLVDYYDLEFKPHNKTLDTPIKAPPKPHARGISPDPDPDPDPEPIPEGLNAEAWNLWKHYRKEMKKAIKPVSIMAAQKQLAQFGADQLAIVERSIANGWQGLFPKNDAKQNVNGSHGAVKQYSDFPEAACKT